MQSAVALVEKLCGPYFSSGKVAFKQAGIGRYVLAGHTSLAENIYKNSTAQIDVLHWFAEFWIYVEMNFQRAEIGFPQVSISLSVFYGEELDTTKNQLFRAEWDNYPGNTLHPQPHWHFYSIENRPKHYEDFEAYVGIRKEEGTFNDELSDDPTDKYFDIRLMHFAMDGRWSEAGAFIHKIESEQMIARWMSGLLKCIKEQLLYIYKDNN